MLISTRRHLQSLMRSSQGLPLRISSARNLYRSQIDTFRLSSTQSSNPSDISLNANSKRKDQQERFLSENVLDTFSLENRVIAITGGAQGIGLALAVAATQAGAKVAILDAAERPHGDYMKLKDISPESRYYK
ncbi:hypothetical protein N7510_005908 [Penicillium lagena]|uniref:uncharacterized protein n=1 Tax=Penicillium lagena TaxID=94218 RepID=UPI00253FEA26|nr:uncharacterized protein N7510_005908 [Penicillium lagena]KAJ5612714.1 hypothetical protein N7510_005908 [Penicillium lagena]